MWLSVERYLVTNRVRLRDFMGVRLRNVLSFTLAALLIAAFEVVWLRAAAVSAQPRADDRNFSGVDVGVGPRMLMAMDLAVDRGVFLVAKTHLSSRIFSQTVILMVEHGAQGSIGLIINRPSHVSLTQIVPKAKELGPGDSAVYFGGPVSSDVVVLLARVPSTLVLGEAIHVFADVYFSSSFNLLEDLLNTDDPEEVFHAYVGYAGWGPGQLEHEIQRGDWFVVPGDVEKVFSADPESIWPEMIRALSGHWVLRPLLPSVSPSAGSILHDVSALL